MYMNNLDGLAPAYVVGALADDEMAKDALNSFIAGGHGLDRRARRFGEMSADGTIAQGTIRFTKTGQTEREIPVQAQVFSSMNDVPDGAFLYFSSPGFPGGRQFTTVKKNMKLARVPRMTGSRTAQIRPVAIFPNSIKSTGNTKAALANIYKNAANEVGALITSANVFRPDFLEFPGGDEAEHFKTYAQWVLQAQPIKLISACCLNADEPRTGIVDQLDPELITTFVRTSMAAFMHSPNISQWDIFTFGPDDYDWLGELNAQAVLLPYMLSAPREKVIADMTKNFGLVQKLAMILDRYLPFPVRAYQLAADTQDVDIPWLVEESRKRAEQMMPTLLKNPPKIFDSLPNYEAKRGRIQQEAFLYLLDTMRFGQRVGQDRPAILNCGVEVHGQYWMSGSLFKGPSGEFLPLSWFPQCVRQHWGEWTKKNKELASQRSRLEAILNRSGVGAEVVVTEADVSAFVVHAI